MVLCYDMFKDLVTNCSVWEQSCANQRHFEKIKEFERLQLPMNCEELTRLIEECWAEDPLQRPTFFEICEKLIVLKKMFLRGTYSARLHPKFEKDGASLQKNSRIEKAKEVHENHIIKVRLNLGL